MIKIVTASFLFVIFTFPYKAVVKACRCKSIKVQSIRLSTQKYAWTGWTEKSDMLIENHEMVMQEVYNESNSALKKCP